MKHLLFLILCLTLFSFLSCKTKKSHDDVQHSYSVATINEDAIKTWELKGDAYYEWQKIEEDWKINVLFPTLDKYKIDVNCSDCPRVTLKVILKIGLDGKLTSYQIIDLNVCGVDAPKGFESDLITYFIETSFDESLYGKVIEAYLGQVLKC